MTLPEVSLVVACAQPRTEPLSARGWKAAIAFCQFAKHLTVPCDCEAVTLASSTVPPLLPFRDLQLHPTCLSHPRVLRPRPCRRLFLRSRPPQPLQTHQALPRVCCLWIRYVKIVSSHRRSAGPLRSYSIHCTQFICRFPVVWFSRRKGRGKLSL